MHRQVHRASPFSFAVPGRTHGLTHLSLAVRDPERSARFYCEVFGARIYYRDPATVQIVGPGRYDVLSFERDPERAGKPGGMHHFGFRLLRASGLEAAARAVEAAGGKILDRGEFVPGQPYLFFLDPDGYEVEVWYEGATYRPKATPRRRSGRK